MQPHKRQNTAYLTRHAYCFFILWLCKQFCQYILVIWWAFQNMYELLNLRAFKISTLHKNRIFHCMGKIFCVEFFKVPIGILHKVSYHLTHALKDVYFIRRWKFMSSNIQELVSVLNLGNQTAAKRNMVSISSENMGDPSPESHNALHKYPTVHHSVTEMWTLAHFCYKMGHCGILVHCELCATCLLTAL